MPAATTRPTNTAPLLWILAVGAAVSVFFGTYAHVHDPAGEATISLFFSGTLNLKAWFTTVALLFAALQVLTALRIYGKVKVPREAPAWLGGLEMYPYSVFHSWKRLPEPSARSARSSPRTNVGSCDSAA